MNIKLLSDLAQIPEKNHSTDAGLDLFSTENYSLLPGERKLFKTNVAMAIPAGHFGLILGRSGLAYKNGIQILGGVIDEIFRGDVGVILLNTGKEIFDVKVGSRIAQIVIIPYLHVTPKIVDDLEETERNSGGFGSSGECEFIRAS